MDGEPVAIKRLHLDAADAGHRELRIAQELMGHAFPHVIPILDAGLDLDSDRYFVVMARAEESLQSALERDGARSEEEAILILDAICAALEEIAELVHRDLKPANILRHEGTWKLGDLGIARFVEESTSLRTLKDCLSPSYAAPEQWRQERATKSTDVYALGCIAYALLTGAPPFSGGREELRDQHLGSTPPPLDASPRLQQLISGCLRKTGAARPLPSTVRKQLKEGSTVGSQSSALAIAGAAVAGREAEAEGERHRLEEARRERREIAGSGIAALAELMDELFSRIESQATVAQRSLSVVRGGLMEPLGGGVNEENIRLGSGRLYYRIVFPFLDVGTFPQSGWNVAAGALIGVAQEDPHYPGRSANLWFADRDRQGSFRWWEVPLMTNPFAGRSRIDEPFGISARDDLATVDLALAPIMSRCQPAAAPVPVDFDHQAEFMQRWEDRLAQAATKGLTYPSSLPE